MRRSVNYLETRSDLNHEKFGFFAISLDGQLFLILAALEPSFEAKPLEWRLRHLQRSPKPSAPSAKAPVLMINGRYDFVFPLETRQEPLFRAPGLTRWGQKAYSLRHRAQVRRIAHYEGRRLVRRYSGSIR